MLKATFPFFRLRLAQSFCALLGVTRACKGSAPSAYTTWPSLTHWIRFKRYTGSLFVCRGIHQYCWNRDEVWCSLPPRSLYHYRSRPAPQRL
ncbi:hypothetical protein LZ30DRAFT_718256 [Colletotrichum cereale]|nr:hypothetical protein LZ30DRAFT_718256 [Colletotrichum cereale]